MTESRSEGPTLSCPVPLTSSERITLAHGEGGWLTRQLIERTIAPQFGSSTHCDASLQPVDAGQIAVTTDSFVVAPIVFPGGDIGRLAVLGTVNDLVVSGSRPRWLSLSLIIEEGLTLTLLDQVLSSAARAAAEAEVQIVCGDTKVVPRGAADQLYINTTGIGVATTEPPPGPTEIRLDDEIIVSGPIGQHGFAILSAREQLGFDPPIETDCANLGSLTSVLLSNGLLGQVDSPVRAMRDATRGGLTSVLHEWAESSKNTIAIDESAVPVTAEVKGVAELLGIDPLHVANEGVMVLAVAQGNGQTVVDVLKNVDLGRHAAVVGTVKPKSIVPVTIRRSLGRESPLDEPSGTLLPRIC